MSRYVMGWVTCASRAEARRLADAVLAAKAAACVNVVAGVESHYWWQGKRECSREWLLVIKTTAAKTSVVQRIIKARHSYQVPEIIFTAITAGERHYLKWLRQSVAVVAVLAASLTTGWAGRVDELLAQLHSSNAEVRAEAAGRLAEIGGERVEQQFRRMLASDNAEQRQMAVVGLLQVSEATEDLARVRARLQDADATVRWSAAMALGQCGWPEAIPWLTAVAKADAAETVREAATEAVAHLTAGVRWVRTLPVALQQAKRAQQPVLVYFFVRGTELCQQFEEGVLAEPDVVTATREFVCTRVNAGRQPEVAQQLDVRGAPTVLLLDAAGHELGRAVGLMAKAKLAAQLAEASRRKAPVRAARQLALREPGNVLANWQAAQGYLDEGREDLADPFLRNVIAHDEGNRYGYTDRALFALAFTLGRRGQYAQSVIGFERLLAKWPGYPDKDKALYCLGLNRLALGRTAPARAALEELVREFPNSRAVPGAKQVLEKLGGK
jgi:periplasmic divalent cation tolerance protein